MISRRSARRAISIASAVPLSAWMRLSTTRLSALLQADRQGHAPGMTRTGHDGDTIIDRIGRVKHSLVKEAQPRAVQVAVDGHCPEEGCNALLAMVVHSDSASITCTACGGTFEV